MPGAGVGKNAIGQSRIAKCENSSFTRLQERHRRHTDVGYYYTVWASSDPSPRLSCSRLCCSSINSLVPGLTLSSSSIRNRAFSSIPHLRPSILASNGTVFRPCNSGNTLLSRLPPTTTLTAGVTGTLEGVLDIVPRSAITAHPALAGPQQVRCGPRPTMATTSRLVRKRRHGFLSRLRTRNGRKTLQRRREKKRSVMSM